MARPRKHDEDRRTETMRFRLTPAERMHLEQDALAAGLTPSEYARMRTIGGRVIVRQSRALAPEVFAELRRIGINLNQLARIANQTGRLPRELARACAAVEQLLLREIDGHGS